MKSFRPPDCMDNRKVPCKGYTELEQQLAETQQEIRKANNEFGSENLAPDLWRRIGEIKHISGEYWQETETLKAENERLREVLSNIEAECQKGIRVQIIDTDICWHLKQALEGEHEA